MRYVVLAAGTMIFFLWDGLFNDGRYLDYVIRAIVHFFSYFGFSI